MPRFPCCESADLLQALVSCLTHSDQQLRLGCNAQLRLVWRFASEDLMGGRPALQRNRFERPYTSAVWQPGRGRSGNRDSAGKSTLCSPAADCRAARMSQRGLDVQLCGLRPHPRTNVVLLSCSAPQLLLLVHGRVLCLQLIADLVRRLNCIAPSTTLDCLMALRFPDIVSPPAPSGCSCFLACRASYPF